MAQIHFDPDDYADRKECLAERKRHADSLRAQGLDVHLWTLRGQQRGYSGLGTARNLSCRNVYMLDYNRRRPVSCDCEGCTTSLCIYETCMEMRRKNYM